MFVKLTTVTVTVAGRCNKHVLGSESVALLTSYCTSESVSYSPVPLVGILSLL